MTLKDGDTFSPRGTQQLIKNLHFDREWGILYRRKKERKSGKWKIKSMPLKSSGKMFLMTK